MARSGQLALGLSSGWGGKRKNAGRKPIAGRRRPTPHRARPQHKARFPVHVTLRARASLPSLRSPTAYPAIRDALSAASTDRFRLNHFSVQSDHLHLIVEAHDTAALERGIRGLAIRVARAINRALERTGPVWGDRYHARTLESPREVRHGLVYVLFNHRKHRPAERQRIDPCSSACWFDGFRTPLPRSDDPPATRAARTWLGTTGWRRRGLIRLDETPQPAPRRSG
jgi:REP-associated tyrosine transposase